MHCRCACYLLHLDVSALPVSENRYFGRSNYQVPGTYHERTTQHAIDIRFHLVPSTRYLVPYLRLVRTTVSIKLPVLLIKKLGETRKTSFS